jgi:hypothetical protein
MYNLTLREVWIIHHRAKITELSRILHSSGATTYTEAHAKLRDEIKSRRAAIKALKMAK